MGDTAVTQDGDFVAVPGGQMGHSFPPGSLTMEPFILSSFQSHSLDTALAACGLQTQLSCCQEMEAATVTSSQQLPVALVAPFPYSRSFPHRGQQDCDGGREGEQPAVAESEGSGRGHDLPFPNQSQDLHLWA